MRKTIPQGLFPTEYSGQEAARLSAAAGFFLSGKALLTKELFLRTVPSDRQGLCFGFNKTCISQNIFPVTLPRG